MDVRHEFFQPCHGYLEQDSRISFPAPGGMDAHRVQHNKIIFLQKPLFIILFHLQRPLQQIYNFQPVMVMLIDHAAAVNREIQLKIHGIIGTDDFMHALFHSAAPHLSFLWLPSRTGLEYPGYPLFFPLQNLPGNDRSQNGRQSRLPPAFPPDGRQLFRRWNPPPPGNPSYRFQAPQPYGYKFPDPACFSESFLR